MELRTIACKCGKEFLEGSEALSRVDNETEICSECGQKEAIEEFEKKVIRLF